MKEGMVRIVFLLLGFVFVGLGVVGAVLPILPTTPLMILALACFSRSSKQFHDWLYNHRIFGPPLQQWDRYRVIPVFAKVMAVSAMSGSLVYVIAFSEIQIFAAISVGLFMVYGAWFILSKPSYPPERVEEKM